MTTSFWIEKAWGDFVDNVTMDDIKVAIQETLVMDDEHGAFWVGNYDNECVMEVHKDLKLSFESSDNPDNQVTTELSSWTEVERFYELFLDNHYEQIETELRTR